MITSNRITMPETAEEILARGDADMISMARPFLADADWVAKAADNRSDEINSCIGCNQACLDHSFARKRASCLVNPRAAHETELKLLPTRRAKRIAVVGAGPAGLATATNLAARGHAVDLFEADDAIGGQFNLARRIPGKEEFAETLRYYTRQIELTGVKLHLNHPATAQELIDGAYDDVVLATGVAAAHAVDRGSRPSERALLRRRGHRSRDGRAARRRDRGGRDRLRRQRVPHPQRASRACRRTATTGCASGASPTRP